MTTTHLPPTACPCCGHQLDAATGVDALAAPKAGDLSVCFHCAALLAFDDDAGAVHELGQPELDALDTDTLMVLCKAQAATRDRLARKAIEAAAAAKAQENPIPPEHRTELDKLLPGIAKALDTLFIAKLGRRMPFCVVVDERHGMNFISNYDDREAMADLRRLLRIYDENGDKVYRVERDGQVTPAFDAAGNAL